MENTEKEIDFSKYPRDEKGNILIKEKDFIPTGIDITRYFLALEWVILDGKMALIKNHMGAVFPTLTPVEREIAYYNNFLLPELCKQFEVPSAKYYSIKRLNSRGRPKSKVEELITPSFLKSGEELIHGIDLLGSGYENEFRVKKILERVRRYLQMRKFPEEEIELWQQEFLKQTLFNRVIKHVDEHNENWGIIVKGRHVKMAHNYDMDFSCGLPKRKRVARQLNDVGENNLALFCIIFKKQPWLKKYLGRVLENLDIEKCYEQVEENTGIHISDSAKEYYNTFFESRFSELRRAYDKIFFKKSNKESNVDDGARTNDRHENPLPEMER